MLSPTSPATPAITTPMRAAIRPYSMAVTPFSSAKKALMAEVIVLMTNSLLMVEEILAATGPRRYCCVAFASEFTVPISAAQQVDHPQPCHAEIHASDEKQ